jgi:2-polyprenyl-3-methyl-5-hydroxy-6-metoxy-1,4-benzoquinol methylase
VALANCTIVTINEYDSKPEHYFAYARREIGPLLPAKAERVLEIGCGAGATLAWIKGAGIAGETVGVEISSTAATAARTCVDRVVQANAEVDALPDDLGQFDLILCLDVLEHMVDPWAFVNRIQQRLKPGGQFISSIPNVRHFKALAPLLLAGRWEYQEIGGILDRTHLRFFTEGSARELMTVGKLTIQQVIGKPPAKSKSAWLDKLTLGVFRPFVVVQYLIRSGLAKA